MLAIILCELSSVMNVAAPALKSKSKATNTMQQFSWQTSCAVFDPLIVLKTLPIHKDKLDKNSLEIQQKFNLFVKTMQLLQKACDRLSFADLVKVRNEVKRWARQANQSHNCRHPRQRTVCEYKIPSGVTKMTTARMKFAAGAMESFHLTTKFPFSGSPSKDIGNNPRLFVTK